MVKTLENRLPAFKAGKARKPFYGLCFAYEVQRRPPCGPCGAGAPQMSKDSFDVRWT